MQNRAEREEDWHLLQVPFTNKKSKSPIQVFSLA